MPRNGQGVYSLPPVYEAVTGETIQAQQHNAPLEDIANDLNQARSIATGGTGGQSATQARDNLSVYSKSEVDARTTGAPGKAIPADNDRVMITDSEDETKVKRVLWSNIKSTLKAYFDTLYAVAGNYLPLSGGTINGSLAVNGDLSTQYGLKARYSYNSGDSYWGPGIASYLTGTAAYDGGLYRGIFDTFRNLGANPQAGARIQYHGDTNRQDWEFRKNGDFRTPGNVIIAGAPSEGFHAATKSMLDSGLSAKFNNPTGSTSQYLRGDGSPATMNKSAVGLGNVENTSDASKPVSSATQTALNGKANTSHTHTAGQVTDFNSAADARVMNRLTSMRNNWLGTYVLAYTTYNNDDWGAIVPGSVLYPAGFDAKILTSPSIVKRSTTLSGTWCLMGYNVLNSGEKQGLSLYYKIAD